MLNSKIYRKSQRQSSRVICKPKIDFSFLQPTASSRIIFFFLIPRCELDRLFVGNPTLLVYLPFSLPHPILKPPIQPFSALRSYSTDIPKELSFQ